VGQRLFDADLLYTLQFEDMYLGFADTVTVGYSLQVRRLILSSMCAMHLASALRFPFRVQSIADRMRLSTPSGIFARFNLTHLVREGTTCPALASLTAHHFAVLSEHVAVKGRHRISLVWMVLSRKDRALYFFRHREVIPLASRVRHPMPDFERCVAIQPSSRHLGKRYQ